MRKNTKHSGVRVVLGGVLGILSYMVLMALLFLPLVAGF